MKATMLNPPCWDPKMVEVKPLFTTSKNPKVWWGASHRVVWGAKAHV